LRNGHRRRSAFGNRACASCHAEEGGEGTELEPELLTDHGNAFDIWDYVVISMPEDDPGDESPD
jgi:hypothetical protein